MLYAIMYFFFTPLFLYIYLMLIFSHFTFDNDGMKSSKRQVTFISLYLLVKMFPEIDHNLTVLFKKKILMARSTLQQSCTFLNG